MLEPTPLEIERRNRIRLSVAAYAYEVLDETIMPDAEFDALADLIKPSVATGHTELDQFFMSHFDPFTGIWVRKHPDQAGLLKVCQGVYNIGFPVLQRVKKSNPRKKAT